MLEGRCNRDPLEVRQQPRPPNDSRPREGRVPVGYGSPEEPPVLEEVLIDLPTCGSVGRRSKLSRKRFLTGSPRRFGHSRFRRTGPEDIDNYFLQEVVGGLPIFGPVEPDPKVFFFCKKF